MGLLSYLGIDDYTVAAAAPLWAAATIPSIPESRKQDNGWSTIWLQLRQTRVYKYTRYV
jgi:hypothetical protein